MGYPFSSPNGYEEKLNEQFAGCLYYSLQFSPTILNRVHAKTTLSFSDEARLVAHQNSPLSSYTDDGPDREIDWVIGDKDQLVGYESKYGDSLHREQLQDELEKLRLNADGRDVSLVTVTPHTTPPGILNQFEDEPVIWISWGTVARRLAETQEEDVPQTQRPLLRMLQDLFEAEDMHPFTGFDHQDKQQYRYFIRDLRQELVGTRLKNPGKVHTATTKDSEPPSWRRLVPKRLDIPFVDESRDDGKKFRSSYMTVTVDTETHEVHAGIVFNLRRVERHREYVADHLDDLVDHAEKEGLEMWASMNSFNQWKLGVSKTTDPDEMRQWLVEGGADVVDADGTEYKKATFMRECTASDPSSLVRETKEQLLDLYKKFLRDDDVYPWPTLDEEEQ